jgi:hypothetical protein
MKMTPFQIKKKNAIKKQVFKLYEQGLTTREIGNTFKKSNTWAWGIIKSYPHKTLDKSLQV